MPFHFEIVFISAIHVEGPILQVANITRACGTRFVCLAENKYSDSPINMTFDVEVACKQMIHSNNLSLFLLMMRLFLSSLIIKII